MVAQREERGRDWGSHAQPSRMDGPWGPQPSSGGHCGVSAVLGTVRTGVGKSLSGAVLPRQCKPPTPLTTTRAGLLRVWEKPGTPRPRPAVWMENLTNCWLFGKTQGPAGRSLGARILVGGSTGPPDWYGVIRQDKPRPAVALPSWFAMWPQANYFPSLGGFHFSVFKIWHYLSCSQLFTRSVTGNKVVGGSRICNRLSQRFPGWGWR